MQEIIMILLAAILAALLIAELLGTIIPRESVFVRIKFSWSITPGLIAFTWMEQTHNVCQYPTRPLHRLWEHLLLPRKTCKVRIKAGEQKFENLLPGSYWFILEQTGKYSVGFRKAEPVAKGTNTKGRSWAEMPHSVGPFHMPVQFESSENIRVYFTPVGSSSHEIEFQ
jgi:hypothetical protein